MGRAWPLDAPWDSKGQKQLRGIVNTPSWDSKVAPWDSLY